MAGGLYVSGGENRRRECGEEQRAPADASLGRAGTASDAAVGVERAAPPTEKGAGDSWGGEDWTVDSGQWTEQCAVAYRRAFTSVHLHCSDQGEHSRAQRILLCYHAIIDHRSAQPQHPTHSPTFTSPEQLCDRPPHRPRLTSLTCSIPKPRCHDCPTGQTLHPLRLLRCSTSNTFAHRIRPS